MLRIAYSVLIFFSLSVWAQPVKKFDPNKKYVKIEGKFYEYREDGVYEVDGVRTLIRINPKDVMSARGAPVDDGLSRWRKGGSYDAELKAAAELKAKADAEAAKAAAAAAEAAKAKAAQAPTATPTTAAPATASPQAPSAQPQAAPPAPTSAPPAATEASDGKDGNDGSD